MSQSIEVTFTPADFEALSHEDLGDATCVVFDVLRATSSMVTALAAGATAILPVREIEEAVALRRSDPAILLAGERDGVRITGALSGGVDFDLGNSPREFTAEKVAGRTIAMTTTNGTRALAAVAKAKTVFVGSFLNLSALVSHQGLLQSKQVILVCSGTHEEAAYEDTIAAGALCRSLRNYSPTAVLSDGAAMARLLYLEARDSLMTAMQNSRNGRRLLEMPDLAADVRFCMQRDRYDVTPVIQRGADGIRVVLPVK